MKMTINKPTEIIIERIEVSLPVRYEEEDIPNDFPLRKGDSWKAVIDIDTGKIRDWPIGKSGSIEYMKVCDSGVYTLLDDEGDVVAHLEYYVPHGIIPGEYGDYVTLHIDSDGIITNWPKAPDLSDFFDDWE